MVFSKDSRVKIPCILHWTRLGYRYLSLKEVEWDQESNIFPTILNEDIACSRNPKCRRFINITQFKMQLAGLRYA